LFLIVFISVYYPRLASPYLFLQQHIYFASILANVLTFARLSSSYLYHCKNSMVKDRSQSRVKTWGIGRWWITPDAAIISDQCLITDVTRYRFFYHIATEHTESTHCAERAQRTHSCRHCRWLYFLSLFFL